MNPLLNMFGGGNSGNMVLMQAIGAAMRGESPQAFMKKLANTHPQLKRMNLDDLCGSAQQLCNEKGINADELAKTVDTTVNQMINK